MKYVLLAVLILPNIRPLASTDIFDAVKTIIFEKPTKSPVSFDVDVMTEWKLL